MKWAGCTISQLQKISQQEAGQEGQQLGWERKERKLISTWNWLEHFLVFSIFSVSSPRRVEVCYLDGKIGNYKLDRLVSALLASWEWTYDRQQNFLSVLPIPWPQPLGLALPVSEEMSLLIPGLGDQICSQTKISSNGNFTKLLMTFWPPFLNPLSYIPIYLESRQDRSIIWLGFWETCTRT